MVLAFGHTKPVGGADATFTAKVLVATMPPTSCARPVSVMVVIAAKTFKALRRSTDSLPARCAEPYFGAILGSRDFPYFLTCFQFR